METNNIQEGFCSAFVQCDLCSWQWSAVYPAGLEYLECAGCGNMVQYTVVYDYIREARLIETMTIVNTLPFVLDQRGKHLGLADGASFASRAWIISDDAFMAMEGTAFTWIAPDGKSYKENKSIFRRPTEAEIRQYIGCPVRKIALEKGYLLDNE